MTKRPSAPAATLSELWDSDDLRLWEAALERYWSFVPCKNMEIERDLNRPILPDIATMSPETWFDFLHDRYFVWKYTAPNRLATTRVQLKKYKAQGELGALDAIRRQLLTLDQDDIRESLGTACKIRGLGTAGASGLLSLMYPDSFATVDQFVVKALRELHLPERAALNSMNPIGISIRNAVLLTSILREKAASLNKVTRIRAWTPRKLDMVLWTYGR